MYFFNFEPSKEGPKKKGLISGTTVLRLVTLLILTLTFAPYFGKKYWLIDELVNFRFHCALLTIVMLIMSVLIKFRFGYTFIFIAIL